MGGTMAASDRGRRSSVSASPPPAGRGMWAWLWLAVSGSWSEREYHSCAPSSRTETSIPAVSKIRKSPLVRPSGRVMVKR